MPFKTSFTGDRYGNFVYTKKLLNPSSAASRLRGVKKKTYRYTTMNAYQSYTCSGVTQKYTREAWRKLSPGGDKDFLSTPSEFPWGPDVSPPNPQAESFTYEPYGVPYAAEVSDEAMTKLFSAVHRAKESGFDAALFMKELPQTWSLFASTAVRINRSFRYLRRGQVRLAYRELGAQVKGLKDVRVPKGGSLAGPNWANMHLEWTYGVTPLLNDIDAAAKKLADLLISKPPFVRVSGRSSRAIQNPLMIVRPAVPGSMRQYSTSSESQLRVQHVLWYTVSNEMVAHAESLGLINPLSLMYQAAPLSFVFDWMVGIGGWLKNLSTFTGLSFHSGCTARSGHSSQTHNYGSFESQTYSYQSEGQGGYLWVDFRDTISACTTVQRAGGFRRDIWSQFPPLPPVRFSLPATAANALSKLTSSLELLYQRRRQ